MATSNERKEKLLTALEMMGVLEEDSPAAKAVSGYLDMNGAMQFTTLSRVSLWKARRSGLRSYKWGKKVLFDPIDLRSWIAGLEVKCVERKGNAA